MKSDTIIIALICVVAVATAGTVVVLMKDQGQDRGQELVPVTVGVYDMTSIPYDPNDPQYYDKPKPASYYKEGDYTMMVKEGRNEVLYITFDTFAGFFKNDIAEGASCEVTTQGAKSTWTVTKDGKELYHLSVDADDMTIKGHGDPDASMKGPKNTLMDQTQFSMTEIEGAGNEYAYSFQGYGLDPIRQDGKIYYPLALLSISFQSDNERMFVYSSKDRMLFEYAKSEQLASGFSYGTYGDTTISNIETESFRQYEVQGEEGETTIVPPEYMLQFTRDLFFFAVDNYYGLNSVLGYKSMADYISNTTYADNFMSVDPKERSIAYSYVLSLLNDGHTGFTGSQYLREGGTFIGYGYPQTLQNDRQSLSSILVPIRSAELKKAGEDVGITDVRYSSDGTTAYFSFDGFNSIVYYDDEEKEKDKLNDTYYLFVDHLNQIKARGNVERVVLDITTNGGGYVLIMAKLLALLSKDNNQKLYLKNENSGTMVEYSVRVDSNGDGVYDEQDCFGQYFKFYIVTSACSFSCGNAFPYYAQHLGLAKVYGTKSGGGECVVQSINLPFGQQIRYSTHNHIGVFDEDNNFIGDEGGAAANTLLNTNMYDVDQMSEYLKKKETPAA